MTGALTSGSRANEIRSMATNWAKWSPARTRFQRNRLADRPVSIDLEGVTGWAAAIIGGTSGVIRQAV